MKNKIGLSQSLKLSNTAYAVAGCFFVLLCILISYFIIGDRSEALAADGNGTCRITIPSGETGYNAGFKPYKINIEAEILRVIPDRSNCINGFNFNIEVAYNISYDGPGRPHINTLQGHIICQDYTLWFEFPNHVKHNAGSGTFITSVNPWRGLADCGTITPEALGCNTITITIDGEGIPAQSNVVCPNYILLPITLTEFKAHNNDSGNLLQWTTSSELNNDFFTLERSSDGKNFETIATIDGAGDSNVKQAYQFLDRNPALGNNFYRLKQTDFDGKFEYFKILLVNNSGKPTSTDNHHELKIQEVYPNPFADEANFKFEAGYEGLVELKIHNIQGESVYIETIACSPGINYHTFSNIAHLQSGVYFFTLQNDAYSTKPQRLVKL